MTNFGGVGSGFWGAVPAPLVDLGAGLKKSHGSSRQNPERCAEPPGDGWPCVWGSAFKASEPPTIWAASSLSLDMLKSKD